MRLAKALYDRNLDAEQTQQLIDFIDWLMILDEKREARFDAELRKYEEERTVPILPPRQIRIIEREKREAALEALHEAVIDILDLRFAPVPADIVETVRQTAERNTLTRLLMLAAQMPTLDEFRSMLQNN